MEESMRQTSNIVKHNRKTDVGNLLGWDAMIRDAKKQIEDLKFSIEVFEKRKAAGEPWPGQLHGQKSEQQHSV
jgi:hypothetical protein